MSIDTDRTPHVDRSDDILLPAQRTPVARRVDHVRTHGRSCWWNHVECRWQCP